MAKYHPTVLFPPRYPSLHLLVPELRPPTSTIFTRSSAAYRLPNGVPKVRDSRRIPPHLQPDFDMAMPAFIKAHSSIQPAFEETSLIIPRPTDPCTTQLALSHSTTPHSPRSVHLVFHVSMWEPSPTDQYRTSHPPPPPRLGRHNLSSRSPRY